MPLGTKVGLGPGGIVTWGPSSMTQNGHSRPSFWPMSIMAKWLSILAIAEHLCFLLQFLGIFVVLVSLHKMLVV